MLPTLAVTILTTTAGSTDKEVSRHAVFAELGGSALIYSINYEFRPTPVLGLRAGGGPGASTLPPTFSRPELLMDRFK